MGKRIGVVELKARLSSAIAHKEKRIDRWTGQTNPQIVEMYNHSLGRRNAYQNVLDALNGDKVMIRLASERD